MKANKSFFILELSEEKLNRIISYRLNKDREEKHINKFINEALDNFLEEIEKGNNPEFWKEKVRKNLNCSFVS